MILNEYLFVIINDGSPSILTTIHHHSDKFNWAWVKEDTFLKLEKYPYTYYRMQPYSYIVKCLYCIFTHSLNESPDKSMRLIAKSKIQYIIYEEPLGQRGFIHSCATRKKHPCDPLPCHAEH